ncbi:MAG TPA: ABC transporter ATP-binding protein [Aggregatilineales bacterium]|nr:ABC transporter ATP-binding protein [Aggregatilineales bacterium]
MYGGGGGMGGMGGMSGQGGGMWRRVNATDERPTITLQLLRRVLGYARPYRGMIIGLLMIILVTSGLALITPLIMRDLIDYALPAHDLHRLILLALGLLIIPVINAGLTVWQRQLNAAIGEGVVYDLRTSLFAHLQDMSLRFFTNTKVGELMSRLNNDVVGAQTAISNTIVSIITDVVQLVTVIAVMLSLEWRLTLISILILPLFIITARRLSTRLRDIARQALDANAQMNAMMNETLNISGVMLVKLFGRAPLETSHFNERAAKVRALGIQRAVWAVLFFALIGLFTAVGTALVYGIGGYLVIQATFSVGTIVAFGVYLRNLYTALQDLANAPVDVATSVVSFERVFEVIDLPLEIETRPNAIELKNVRGDLTFEDVSFRYDLNETQLLSAVKRFGQIDNVNSVLSDKKLGGNGNGKPGDDEDAVRSHNQARASALRQIAFSVTAGQLVALVGPSGAGKTTLTYLIPRLYDPSEGRVLLDGHDLRDVTLVSLMAQIGMVTQETHLFHDTIRTNLLYAKLDATQAELESAARAANIHDFITGLPDTYDTVVGERGYRLSGGEKQRVALARVILKDPRILVLDEATSHLDSESEALIQEALKRVMAGRTSIVIAHRLSTILAADLILTMDRGQIVERGTHEELLRHGGLYAHLYKTQFSSHPAGAN